MSVNVMMVKERQNNNREIFSGSGFRKKIIAIRSRSKIKTVSMEEVNVRIFLVEKERGVIRVVRIAFGDFARTSLHSG